MASKTIDALKQVSIFSLLTEKDLQEILSISVQKSYKKNEVVFHQGDPGSVLFVLISGVVKISLFDSKGKEIILKMLYEKSFFGEMSLLDGQFRSATVTAIEKSKALIIYPDNFTRLIKQKPHFVFEMLATLNRRLRKADEKIASLTFFDAYGKVAQVLLDLSEEKGKRDGDIISLDLDQSRHEMAKMAGITRETFTRILNEFQVRGCVKVDNKKLLILDSNILKRETL